MVEKNSKSSWLVVSIMSELTIYSAKRQPANQYKTASLANGNFSLAELWVDNYPGFCTINNDKNDTYTLPAITGTNLSRNEAYYTATNGTGTKYAAGDVLTSSTTLYIYDAKGTCSSETSIEITVTKSPTTGSIFVPDSSTF